ncbi:hypothetical protein AB4876_09165 [Zhongshania guokunii]|uniref:Uncharacterized protein n=1 Tax=Zhongshania guokunii TaxID=641783 RepID=A0ABV3U546_9GAMM|tara:strand:+ start:6393 stop:6650 length:258 start_codon:yes stop_codon:yes gene_type:complete
MHENQNHPTHSTGTPEQTAAATIKDWVTINQFCVEFPNIPEPTVRWQLTTRKTNGLAPHVKVLGKQRFISILGYAAWLSASSPTY